MGILRGPAVWLFDNLPESVALKNLFKRYLDRVHGDNDPDMSKNGELALLKKLLPVCRTVFDVGANVGDWTALALELKPDLRVHCFEPGPETFKTLVKRGFPASVRCNAFGLGQARGSSKLYHFGERSTLSSMFPRSGLQQAGIGPAVRTDSIRIETLDRYAGAKVTGRIDLVKLDVEGNELSALKGMKGCLASKRIRFIQFEYGGTYRDSKVFLKDLFDYFALFPAYRLYKIFPDGLRAAPEYGHEMDNFEYSNWLASCEPGTLERAGLWKAG